LLARITSKPPKSPRDIPLSDWRASNLMLASTLRIDKLTTLLSERIEEKIGSLSNRDRERTLTGLRDFVESLSSMD
jgi:hypothetical protein